jgi:hypothetical protein
MMDRELNRKLGEIIKEAMIRDGVLPKRAWNPNFKTVTWLKDRGFNMGHSRKGYRWGPWSMAYGTKTPRGGQMEGFVKTLISWHIPSKRPAQACGTQMTAWIFVPEDMVEKILVLGCP